MITKPIYIKDEWNCKILIRIIKIRAQFFYTKDWITVEKKLQHFNLHLSLSLSSKTWKILRFPERKKKKKKGENKKISRSSIRSNESLPCWYLALFPRRDSTEFSLGARLSPVVLLGGHDRRVQRDNYTIMLPNHVTHIEKVETQRGSFN